jgi:nitroreductase
MDAIECIYTRRSVRRYKDIPVEWELIGRIVEAGGMAPTAGNIQDYRFIVIQDEARKKQIAEACLQQYWMESAPVIIVACAEIKRAKLFYGVRGERLYTIQNVAAAMENMLLASHNFGLGACWVGAFDENMIKRACGIPDYARAHAIMTLGHPDEQPPRPEQYKLESLFYFEKYSNRIKDVHVVVGEYSPTVARHVKSVKDGLDKNTNKFLDHVGNAINKLTGKKKKENKKN